MPSRVVELFDGSDLRAMIGRGYLLVTVDPDGVPRPCMLSAGEVLAVNDQRLRLGLWRGSQTSRNLASGSPVLFCVVDGDGVLYLRGTALGLANAAGPEQDMDCFEISIAQVESDVHEGMPVSRGIEFTVADRSTDDVVSMWRAQLAAIRRAQPVVS